MQDKGIIWSRSQKAGSSTQDFKIKSVLFQFVQPTYLLKGHCQEKPKKLGRIILGQNYFCT